MSEAKSYLIAGARCGNREQQSNNKTDSGRTHRGEDMLPG